MQPANDLKVVLPEAAVAAPVQGVPYSYGVSDKSVGSTGLSLHLVEIPPGATGEPHSHVGFETAIFVIEGNVETRYGSSLENSVINGSGSFLFIPPGVPHQPFNLSKTEPVRAIVARNDPSGETEKIIPYPQP